MNKLKYILPLLALFFTVACSDDDKVTIDPIYPPEEPEKPIEKPPFHKVEARANSTSNTWTTYTAKTVDRLPGYEESAEPELSRYGGWKLESLGGTGHFRTELRNGRWWFVDPDGYPFIHAGVAVFETGSSDRSKAAMTQKFGTKSKWAEQETAMLKSYGFRGTGAWTSVSSVKNLANPMPYTVFIEPMKKFRTYLESIGDFEGSAGWQGYPNDVVRVFDPRFDQYIESEAKKLEEYRNDANFLGYFTDNELPWVNDALDRFLKNYPDTDAGHKATQEWLNARKGFVATVSDITEADRKAFTGFYFETYLKKVSAATRKYAPDKLYLGCRFNQHEEEMKNQEMFKVAGQYLDVVSINYYRKWEPDATWMNDWVSWSGIPFMITEFYVKGEDTDLPNATGAGWNVKTQAERGYYYQNFVLELIKSGGCVGWHWFKYLDNDPEDLTADPSNRDSNKGIVTWNYQPYNDVLDNMKAVNSQIYQLSKFYDE